MDNTILTQMTAVLQNPQDIRPYMGCDPEFFLKLNGETIGAEKVLPKNGILSGGHSKIIIDGVACELNPSPSYCRDIVCSNIAGSFYTLQQELLKQGKGVTADFSQAIEITQENLDQLSDDNKKFGCAPSKQVYDEGIANSKSKLSEIDPSTYRVRAAGGHIHISKEHHEGAKRAIDRDTLRTVEMLDIICGNTMVLVDRDPANIERRKTYGRAGEHRTPKHGLEYRTLSNFWLTSRPLMSLAFGMARLAIQLMADAKYEQYYKAFTAVVSKQDIVDAINNNDAELAMKNFKAIQPLLEQVIPASNVGGYPIDKLRMPAFHHFVSTIQKQGFKQLFPTEPMSHWINRSDGKWLGFRDYLIHVTNVDMAKQTQAEKDHAAFLKRESEMLGMIAKLSAIKPKAKSSPTAKRVSA